MNWKKPQLDYRFHILYFLSYCTIFGYTSYEQTVRQEIVSKQVHNESPKIFTELQTLFLLYRCNYASDATWVNMRWINVPWLWIIEMLSKMTIQLIQEAITLRQVKTLHACKSMLLKREGAWQVKTKYQYREGYKLIVL